MKNKIPNSVIENQLEELKDIPRRNPQKAAQGRARFLSEAATYRQAVSARTAARHSSWIFPIRKEKFAMNALISVILAAALVLGGGATAVAAQDDLPTEPLYPVKLMTENATLALTGDPETKAFLLMNMAQTRVEEMAALANMGETTPAQVQLRLMEQVQQVLELSAGMEEPAMLRTLTQLRTNLQLQEQTMAQLQAQADGEALQLLTQTRERLQTQLRLADEGLADPQGFIHMMQNQMQYGQDEEATPEPNQQGEPGFHQNPDSGPATEPPGNGNPGGPPDEENPDNGNNGLGGSDSGGNGSGGKK